MGKYSYNTEQKKISKGRMFEVLRRPVVTEKSTIQGEFNKFSFYVPLDANKFEIRKAVETIYDTKVVTVNTIRTKGKQKVFRGRKGVRSDYKKAIVTLAEGQTIDIMTGV